MLFAFSTALMEATVPDEKTGRDVNPNFAEYHIAVHADTPDFDIDFIGEPDPHMPDLGARGIGEIGIVGARCRSECNFQRDRQTRARSADHAGQIDMSVKFSGKPELPVCI
jgi:hypothetical protein